MDDGARQATAENDLTAAIGELQRLTAASLATASQHELIALSSLCAHWDLAIGTELVRRHRERRQNK